MDTSFEEIPSNFLSVEQERDYWKTRASYFQKRFEDQKNDFDEYVKFSKDVETELDIELKQNESKVKEMKAHMSRVLAENESLRNRMDQMNAEYNAQLTELTAEVTSFRKTSDELSSYVRLLEQNNDDLERANRAAVVSIEDFETKLNQAIERNAFLESEVEEKDMMKAMVQRLKDETRDLQGELVLRKSGAGTPQHPDNKETYKSMNGVSEKVCRSSPLTLVNSLLTKVGNLENKLVMRKKLHYKDFNK